MNYQLSIKWISVFLIPFVLSCDKEFEKPEFRYADFVKPNDIELITLGDSLHITFVYKVDDPDYKLYEFSWETIQPNKNRIACFLFKAKLQLQTDGSVNPIQDTLTWDYLPMKAGVYDILMHNSNYDTLLSMFGVDHPRYYYSMTNKDYQLIVDSVKNTSNLISLVDTFGTGEFYYGANSFYENFDLRISLRINSGQTEFENLDEQSAKELIWNRLIDAIEIVIHNNFPNANIGDRITIEFETYDGVDNKGKAQYFCRSSMPNLDFEFIEFVYN